MNFAIIDMKIIVQRALSGSVTVDDKQIATTGKGIVCLVGIHKDDKEEDLDWMVNKILKFFCWDADNETPWRKCVIDIDGDVLLVSQFTLYANLGKGRRPDFSQAMPPDRAEPMFNRFVEKVRAAYKPEKVQTGQFGAHMQVGIVNDGPVTFTFDSFNKRG